MEILKKYFNLCLKIHKSKDKSEIGQMNKYIDFVIKCLEPDTIKLLIEEILESYEKDGFSTSQSINKLFQHRLKWIEVELNSESSKISSWEMPNASVPGHPTFEEFLKSTEHELIYQNFNGIAEARKFCATYGGNKQDYSTDMIADGKAKKAFVKITKTADCFTRDNTSLENEEQDIREKIKLYEIAF